MKKSTVILISFLMISSLLINRCTKDKTIYNTDNGTTSSMRTTIAGRVLDENNVPLPGVAVTAYGQGTTTNSNGIFIFKDIHVSRERCIVQFLKAGFFRRSHGFIASGNRTNYLKIILASNTSSQALSASAGGIVSLPDGSTVQFQPNSFVNNSGSSYTGSVSIAIKHLSPDDANFGFSIPGGDLLGKDISDNEVALYSYGMIGVELTGSSGEALQLAAGANAILTFPVASIQQGSAPASIPLWYFDETDFLWKEQGTVTLSGNNYIGTVAHFSWWNCDYTGTRATIKGKVIDCNGTPVPNIIVTVNNFATITTDQNGEFQNWAPAGINLAFQVLSSFNNNLVLNSQIENVPPLSTNQVFIVPPLVIPCPTRVAGTLQTCSGEPTAGFVSVSDANLYIYQYTLNGSFMLNTPGNTQMTLEANNSDFSHQQSILTLTGPAILNTGNILLCDAITGTANNFTIDGGTFSNQLFNISVTSSSASYLDTNSTNSMNISVAGTSFPQYEIQTYIHFNDSLAGPYLWSGLNQVYITFAVGADNYYVASIAGQGSMNLLEVGLTGDRVKGNYTGPATMTINGTAPTTVSLSGNFDALRVN